MLGLVATIACAVTLPGCAGPSRSSVPRARPAVPADLAPVERAPAADPRALAEAKRAAELRAARHLLNRCTFGPRPGEVERVARLGTARWLDEQLGGPAENPLLEPAMISLSGAYLPPAALIQDWIGAEAAEMTDRKNLRERTKPHFREHVKRLATAELTRHVLSHRQLEQVMVDFWVNHFNTYASKGLVRLFAGDYVERAIRPHALGRFSELVVATARHPAMLLYLDNAESRAPGTNPRRPHGGLNENYARELLELHTLGIDGGYSQHDVTEVARILTGFSLEVRAGRLEYRFKKGAHDRGEKRVLDWTFPAGQDEAEGLRLLELLAEHPSTARNIGRKLCARFVSDQPDEACVELAGTAFLSSHGDIGRVVRAIIESPSFLAEGTYDAKLKTPVELVASTARALGAIPDGSLALAEVLQKLGEPLLQESVPTGYPDGETDWASSGAMLARLRFATALGSGDLRGLRIDWDELAPLSLPAPELVARLSSHLFEGDTDERTRSLVEAEIAGLDDPNARRSAAVALLVGSPEFQRQ
jgi:uncharacterized protein (DUF1800 family)